ncbi:hypothetical protein I553_10229 [Mycobacterium xenopi 4042]|uniref:Uncharacterized protein n=1 Tax=Mycobacterium xenopi 4042 TaxID=1299334 RepID=X7ZK46_MYCXE|nr:hypothetical protein I553_10229 [Mycobacterium xenopi 4042]
MTSCAQLRSALDVRELGVFVVRFRAGLFAPHMALLVITNGSQRGHAEPSAPPNTSCAPICIWRNAIGWCPSRRRALRFLQADPLSTNDSDTKALAAFARAERPNDG